MNLIATTVIRHSKVGKQASGRVLEIDWPRQRVIRKLGIPDPRHPASDANPRGGVRGGRGVKVHLNHYYVANYDTVHVYDAEWRLQKTISHPLAADIHEIDLDATGIWLSCSRYDLALKLSLDGEKLGHWHISDSPALMRAVGIRCHPLDLTGDYRKHFVAGHDNTHLNSVQIRPGNSLIVNLGQVRPAARWRRAARRLAPWQARDKHSISSLKRGVYGALHGTRSYVVEVNCADPADTRVIAEYPALRPNHNGQLLSDGQAVLATEDGGILIHHLDSLRDRYIPLQSVWTRGIAKLDEGRILVGIQPCAIVEVDLSAGRVTRHLGLSEDPQESVHGLAVIP